MSQQEMTIPQIEQEFGIPPQTLYHWIRNGLQAKKFGRDYLVDRDVLQRFMEERVEVGTVYKLKDPPLPNQ